MLCTSQELSLKMMKRLVREIADLQRQDLSGLGIYTAFDESNLRKGRAMMIGPAGTPYADCPLFFSIDIPAEYPLVPPRVLIETSDGVTRLHPNLYVGGKVCLSILGTYTGPSWVSTMNIETVLKSIYSLLNENPITNEPGWETFTLTEPRAKAYAEYVRYALARLTAKQFAQFRAAGGNPLWDPFRDILLTRWVTESLPRLRDFVAKKAQASPTESFSSIVYGMSPGLVDWSLLNLSLA